MATGTIAVRYARALFALAKEQSVIEEVYNDLTTLQILIKENRFFKLFLNTPTIPVKEKKNLVSKILQDKFNFLTLKFLLYVFEQRREEFTARMILKFIDFYNEENNIVPVNIKSANDITVKQVKEIEKIITEQLGKTPIIELNKNPELIGGYILTINDMQIDKSVKTALSKFEKCCLE